MNIKYKKPKTKMEIKVRTKDQERCNLEGTKEIQGKPQITLVRKLNQ